MAEERLCPECDSDVALLSVGETPDGEEMTLCPYCGEQVDWEDMEEVDE